MSANNGEREMRESIAIIGTLDTKGEPVSYLKDLINGRGHRAIVIDVGTGAAGGKQRLISPDITSEQVVQAIGTILEEIANSENETTAMEKMAQGLSKIVKTLYVDGVLDGVMAVGGSLGTTVVLEAMKVLPLGFPKLIISTVAFSPFIGEQCNALGDLMMIGWPGGLWGFSNLSKNVLNNAGAAMIAMAEAYSNKDNADQKRKVAGITSMGVSDSRYMRWLSEPLKERGYDVAVFHALNSGRSFERAISQGLIDISLDLALPEIASMVCAGPFAVENRLEAAVQLGIPLIVAPGSINHFGMPTNQPLPARYRKRQTRPHGVHVMSVNTTAREKARTAEVIAEKLNRAKGPAAVVIPLGGVGEFDRPGGIYDPAGLKAFRNALKRKIKPEIKVVELDAHINDKVFADAVIILLDEMTPVQTESPERKEVA